MNAPGTQVAVSPAKTLMGFMEKHKNQIALALPSHITADRMVRLAITAFSQNKALQQCELNSIFSSVVIAAQLGLEIGVGGQGYLVPYKGKATFVPGWQGLVDLVSRAGRATVWTGAVYGGDEFDWALGDSPFVKHRPNGDGDSWRDITHVYAIGRVNGSQFPVIEVWTMDRVIRHLNKYNKVGGNHYALKDDCANMEMYARKVALLQVLKYMPKSIEVQKAVAVSNAIDSGKNFTIDGDIVVIHETEEGEQAGEEKQASVKMPEKKKTAEPAKETKAPEMTEGDRQLQENSKEAAPTAAAAAAHGITRTAEPELPLEEKAPNINAATAGERAYLKNKCNAVGISIEQACGDCGISDLDRLTKDGFQTIKEYLLEMGQGK